MLEVAFAAEMEALGAVMPVYNRSGLIGFSGHWAYKPTFTHSCWRYRGWKRFEYHLDQLHW